MRSYEREELVEEFRKLVTLATGDRFDDLIVDLINSVELRTGQTILSLG